MTVEYGPRYQFADGQGQIHHDTDDVIPYDFVISLFNGCHNLGIASIQQENGWRDDNPVVPSAFFLFFIRIDHAFLQFLFGIHTPDIAGKFKPVSRFLFLQFRTPCR